MISEVLIASEESAEELRKILRLEARFQILLEEELRAKEETMVRTKRLLETAKRLAEMKRSPQWLHWKKYITKDGMAETKKNMDRRLLLTGSSLSSYGRR